MAVRMLLFDRWGVQLRELSGLTSAVWTEELDGGDQLEIESKEPLSKGQRVLWCDQQGLWHEHIVAEVRQQHDDGAVRYLATCENSIAETYGDFILDRRPTGSSAAQALAIALAPTRWQVGTVTVSGTITTEFYRESAREAIQAIQERMGGELWTTIEVGSLGVTARKVNLSRRGEDNGRRFEYSRDMTSITRTYSADDVCTALYGFGKGVETENGGYGRRLDFSSVNDGLMYVADEDARKVWGRPDGNGGVAHVFGKVEFDDCTDASELLELTKAELEVRKQPQVSYEASLVAFRDYGYDFSGVALGDDVRLVDRDMEPEVRVRGRVTKLVRDMLADGEVTELAVGNIVEGADDMLAQQYEQARSLSSRSSAWDVAATTPAAYIEQVMRGLNERFDAGASYIYQSPEQGIIVASVPLDPDSGKPTKLPAEAIQLKGGGFRIADSLKGDGTWDWRTFGTGAGFTADEINAGTLNAGLITAGILSDATGTNYWNMETGDFALTAGALGTGVKVGDSTVASKSDVSSAQSAAESHADDVSSGAYNNAKSYSDAVTKALDDSLTQESVLNRLTNNGAYKGIWLADGELYLNADYIKTGTVNAELVKAGILSDAKGLNYWNMETGEFSLQAGAKVGDSSIVTSVDVLFAISDSSTDAPEDGWQTDPPTWVNGKYIWAKTRTTAGSETSETEAVCITGMRGATGADGTPVTVSSVAYAQGDSGTVVPADGWQEDVPSVGQGSWLWCRVTYSDDTVAYTCSLMGTDGQDGDSVAVQSVTHSDADKATKVVLTSTDGTSSELSIPDGKDGSNGIQGPTGADGKSSYVHFAWATSADGSQGFSTSYSEGKTYIGVCSDSNEADSEAYGDYSWTLIKGETGTGVSAIVEEYYLSTSETGQAGGSWSTSQPEWTKDHYIWTRSHITWTDGTETYTEPVLANAINGANEAVQALDDGLDQEGVFNRLTNNGAVQGIYLDDGKVYINGEYIKANSIASNSIETGAITVDKIEDGAVTGTKIAGTTITGDKIATGTLTAENIAAGTITATEIKDASLTGAKLQDATITGGKIAGATIEATNLAANSVTAEKIAAGAVTADDITTGKLSAKTGGSYWDLDTGEAVFALGSGTTVSGYATSSDLSTVSTTATNAATAASNAQSTANSATTKANSASSAASTAQSTANSAQSTANTASSNASSAKAKTDHITINTNGVTITGTSGNTVFKSTYSSDGIQTEGIYQIKSGTAVLGIKPFGLYYGGTGGWTGNARFWVTDGTSGHTAQIYAMGGSGRELNMQGNEISMTSGTASLAIRNGHLYVKSGSVDATFDISSKSWS